MSGQDPFAWITEAPANMTHEERLAQEGDCPSEYPDEEGE